MDEQLLMHFQNETDTELCEKKQKLKTTTLFQEGDFCTFTFLAHWEPTQLKLNDNMMSYWSACGTKIPKPALTRTESRKKKQNKTVGYSKTELYVALMNINSF